MPDNRTVVTGHEWAERVETDIRAIVPHAHVLAHLEPLSFADHG